MAKYSNVHFLDIMCITSRPAWTICTRIYIEKQGWSWHKEGDSCVLSRYNELYHCFMMFLPQTQSVVHYYTAMATDLQLRKWEGWNFTEFSIKKSQQMLWCTIESFLQCLQKYSLQKTRKRLKRRGNTRKWTKLSWQTDIDVHFIHQHNNKQ